MTDTGETLLKFPVDFPLKVMGRNNDGFRALVLDIVQKHMGEVDVSKIEERPSSTGVYLGLTFTVHATSKAQLDGLYIELSACEEVMFAL